MTMSTPRAPGHLRPLRYQDDVPTLLPLMRASLVPEPHEPAAEAVLQAMMHALAYVPRGETTEAHVRRGRAPFFGWVWEHEGRPRGLITLLPMTFRPWRYLLANIVVHPEMRRQGIGRALVQHALTYVRRRRGQAWLEVETDNTPALALYASLGFREVLQRREWRYTLRVTDARRAEIGARIRPMRGADWPRVQSWLDAAYPSEYRWRWSPRPLGRLLRPDWRGALARWWTATPQGHRWVVETKERRMTAMWAWWPELGTVQRLLYLVAEPTLSRAGVQAGLWALAHALEPVWSLTPRAGQTREEPYFLYLDLPAARHGDVLRAAGWHLLRSLAVLRA